MMRTSTLLLAALLGTPLFAAMGGPDAFGYIWKDSNEPEGPVFNWIDITTTGTLVQGLGDDNVVGPFVMNTDMPYYWYGRKFVWIGSNGYVAFNGGNIASPFPAIPLGSGVNDYIAGFTTDLNFLGDGNQGRCYFYDDADQTIVAWVGVPFWNAAAPTYSGSNTFEIIMSKLDSSITVQILEQTGIVANGSISMGIESVAGSIGLQHSFNTYPLSNYAIRYYMPPASTLEVKDAVPNWNSDVTSGGQFRSRNGAPFQMITNVANVGNVDLEGFTVQGQLLNAAGTVQISETVTIENVGPELDTTVNFTPFFTPNPAGTYRFVSTVGNIPGELVTDNNTLTQELVVVDTTTATHDLNYHGTVDNFAGIGWDGGNGGVGTYIRPPYYPAYVTHSTIRIASDAGTAGYTIKIFDDDGVDNGPGTLLDSVQVPLGSVTAGSQVIPLSAPLTITSGGVYVQWYMLGPNINIAVDATPPFSRRTYEVIDGIWAEYRDRTTQDFFLGLRLTEAPIYDVGCTGFFGLANGQVVGSPTAVRAWVFNYGNEPASSFAVNYRYANGSVVSQNYSGAAIAPGTQTLVTFANYFLPTLEALDQLCAWTTMTNDASQDNDTACVTLQTYVGVEELTALGATIAPNPVQDVLRIEGLPAGNWNVRLLDATGRTVLNPPTTAASGPVLLSTADLRNGIYHLSISNASSNYRGTVVVQH